MITLATNDTDAERILNGSALLEAEKQAHKRTHLKANTLALHLSKFLDEFEGKWDSDEKCDSPEIALDYLDAALYMERHFGRTDNRIQYVKEWYDNLQAFPWER